jgi:hypothetical protein
MIHGGKVRDKGMWRSHVDHNTEVTVAVCPALSRAHVRIGGSRIADGAVADGDGVCPCRANGTGAAGD